MRAIEVCLVSGSTYSSFRKEKPKKRNFKVIKIAYEYDRQVLYERINKRVDLMIKAGLEKEALSLIKYRNYLALDTIGYKEFFKYFDGEIDKKTAIELIKRNSRRYAKRQLTWFRKDKEIYWINPKIDKQRFLQMLEQEIEKMK